jgi:hypothetical protein
MPDLWIFLLGAVVTLVTLGGCLIVGLQEEGDDTVDH